MKDLSYTLTYVQSRLSNDQEPRVIHERKVERIVAPDDSAAHTLMCEFLGKEVVELEQEKYPRKLFQFKRDDNNEVLRERKVLLLVDTEYVSPHRHQDPFEQYLDS